jgi:HlyD family secretion protein
VATAQAALDQQSAGVRRASTLQRFGLIRSPVAGTVVSREVSVGQTVAASLQTPVLFKIAEDLRDVQIETHVSEADVGLVVTGQQVSFSVDAFHERVFAGRVHQIRNNYSVQQNVVTYSVVVRARNEDLSLRPGMTGYVDIRIGERRNVLRVPNAALRYQPADQPPPPSGPLSGPGARREVWRVDARGLPEAVTVRLGLSDGRFTELVAGALQPGDALIVGEKQPGGFAGPKIF